MGHGPHAPIALIVLAGALCVMTTLAVVILASLSAAKKRKTVWRDVAEKMGLTFKPGGSGDVGSISGEYEGVPLRVDVHRVNAGKSQISYTRYSVFPPRRLGLGLKIYRQHIGHKIMKWFGAQDIETGDKPFDETFMVKANKEEEAVRFLTPERRQALLNAVSFKNVEIDDLSATFEDLNIIYDPFRLRTRISLVAEIGGVWIGAGATPADEAKAESEAETVALPARPAASPAAASKTIARKTAREIIDSAAVRHPSTIAPVETAPEPPATGSDVPEMSETGADLATLTDKLFSDNAFAAEIEKRFAPFRAQSARWTGKLLEASRFSRDMDLGDGPAVRTVFSVREVKNQYGFVSAIKAIVKFPEASLDDLKKDVGKTIAFRGELERVNGMSRAFILKDGAREDG